MPIKRDFCIYNACPCLASLSGLSILPVRTWQSLQTLRTNRPNIAFRPSVALLTLLATLTLLYKATFLQVLNPRIVILKQPPEEQRYRNELGIEADTRVN